MTRSFVFYIFPLCSLLMLFGYSCENEETTPTEIKGTPIAKVGEKYLYKEELAELLPQNYTKEDSTNIIDRYVNNWVERQLLLKEAENKSGIDQIELQQRLEDYKFQLLVHAYKQNYVNEYLDTVVTDVQISDYYENNKANFELKQPIAKAYFVKVKNNIPENKLDDLKRWIRSSDPAEIDELKSYSYGFAESYFLEDAKWVTVSDLVANTPFKREELLQRSKVVQESDSLFHYFLRINEVKIQDQVSPLEYVREQIVSVILNKRKVDLQRQLEENIMDRANEGKDYQIFK